MTNYTRGVRGVEHPAAHHLTEDGYRHVRGASSKGFADLVLIKPGAILFVSCKRSGKLPEAEWNDLIEAASWVRAVPLLALRDLDGGCTRRHRADTNQAPPICHVRFMELTSRKIPRALSADQNWRPWVSDQVVPA
jgi:hypothetical protein